MGSSKFTSSPAKILLFGEYAVLAGSEALALPISKFCTSWQPGPAFEKQYELPAFAAFLETLNLPFSFDHESLKNHLKEGWFLASDIPQGYGLGSSGAVVATLLKEFGKGINTKDIPALQKTLANIESFFHGTSSGLDPLVCYLEKAVWVKGENQIEILNAPANTLLNKFFLIDTSKPRKTAPFVQLFKEKYKDSSFKNIVNNELVRVQNDAIQSFLAKDILTLNSNMAIISKLQREHFQEMILPEYLELWDNGLKTGKYYLKLCGAGGGGFILAFSPNGKENLPASIIDLA